MSDDENIEQKVYPAIQYSKPDNWIEYNREAVVDNLIRAKVAVQTLTSLPYQRTWFEPLQELQLKREVAGTSKIEGADFTENELDAAMDPKIAFEQLLTRSQKQAKAVAETYRWIDCLEEDHPIDEDLLVSIHRRIVTGCDDDRCEPGKLRREDRNVTFGVPKHRGAGGGAECNAMFDALIYSINHEYRGHDKLIQALAVHYHLAAMHPFQDGNGRTARAVEALLLKRADLTDRAFIAMSNYYYDEKPRYLACLAEVRAAGHDLTSFLLFALKGIEIQCQRLQAEIRKQVDITLFRDMMFALFGKLESTRKRVIAERQMAILKALLNTDQISVPDLFKSLRDRYVKKKRLLANPVRAFIRDINGLLSLGAIRIESENKVGILSVNLNWPQQISESEFYKQVEKMATAKTHDFLQ